MNLESLGRDAALEQDPGLIDAETRSNSKEAQAWRTRFPKDCARVNTELDMIAKSEPVQTTDENRIWRRWFPDFKFRPQDDMVARV